MIKGVTAYFLGGSQSVLGPLGCHDDFIQSQRTFLEFQGYVLKVADDNDMHRGIVISKARSFDNPLSLLYVFKSKAAVQVCHRPQIIVSDLDRRTWHRIMRSRFHHLASHLKPSRSSKRNERNQQTQY